MGAVLATRFNSTTLPWIQPRQKQPSILMACGQIFEATCTSRAMEEAKFLFCLLQVNCSRSFCCHVLQLLPIWPSVVPMGPPSMLLVVAALQAGAMATVASMSSAPTMLVENGTGSTVLQKVKKNQSVRRIAARRCSRGQVSLLSCGKLHHGEASNLKSNLLLRACSGSFVWFEKH